MSVSTFTMNKFSDALRRYVEVCKKEVPLILNTKAYFVAGFAYASTQKAQAKDINKLRSLQTTRRKRVPTSGGLVIGALINKQLGKGKGLYGAPMKAAIDAKLMRRRSAIAFMRAGWIPAMRGLADKADTKKRAPRIDKASGSIQNPRGNFSAATVSKSVAQILNSAQAKDDTKDALQKIGGPALEKAFRDETANMEEYIAMKMKKHSDEANKHL